MNNKQVIKYSDRAIETICVLDIETLEVNGSEKVYMIGVYIGDNTNYNTIIDFDINIYFIYQYINCNNKLKFIDDNFLNINKINKHKIFSALKAIKIFKLDIKNKKNCIKIYYEFLCHIYEYSKSKNTYIYALNGGKFDHYILINEIVKYAPYVLFEKCMMNNKIYNLTFKFNLKNSCNIKDIKYFHLRDILSITGPFSLQKLCKNLNIPDRISKNTEFNIVNFRKKFQQDCLTKNDIQEITLYLIGDVISLFIIVKKIALEFTKSLKIDINKELTIGNIAYKSFIKSLKYEIEIEQDVSINLIIRQALYGGRVYCLKTYGKNLIEYDVNSLYPAAMLNEYPAGTRILISKATINDIHMLDKKGLLYILSCQLETSKKFKISPIAISKIEQEQYINLAKANKLYFDKEYTYKPCSFINGIFLTSIDLKELIKYGYKIKLVYSIYYWEKKAKFFDNYINEIYTQRLLKKSNETLDLIYKLLMNSLYGKLCQKPILNTISIIHKKQYKNYIQKLHRSSIINSDGIPKGDYLIMYSEHLPMVNKPTHLACFILAYSRKIMNQIFDLLGGFENPRWYYSDTDSVYVTKKDSFLLKKYGFVCQHTIGKLKKEKEHIECIFAGPKMKALKYLNKDNIIKTKITCKGFDIEKVSFNDIYDLVFKNKNISYLNTQFIKSIYDGIKIEDIEKEFKSSGPRDAILSDDKMEWVYDNN